MSLKPLVHTCVFIALLAGVCAPSCRHRWAGVAWSTVLTVGIVAAAATRLGTDLQATAEIGAQFGVALVFAIVLGLWITQVAEQSEERADLLEELRAAQDELASSHHASGVLAERARLAGEIHDTLARRCRRTAQWW